MGSRQEQAQAGAKSKPGGTQVSARPFQPVFEEAYMEAVAVQNAVAAHDWERARTNMDDLKRNVKALSAMRPQMPENFRARLDNFDPLVSRLDQALRQNRPERIIDASQALANGFLIAMDDMTATGGGGGMGTPVQQPAVRDLLENAYRDAAKAQLEMVQRHPEIARIYLDASKRHLQAAMTMQPMDAALRRTLDELHRDVNAALGVMDQPARAYTATKAAVHRFSDAMKAQAIAAMPQRGGGAGTGMTEEEADRLMMDGKDRPNQRGRQ